MSQTACDKISSELTEGSEDLYKLKMLVQSLKKKYGDAVQQAYLSDTKNRELSAENSTLKQTQTALSQKFNETLVELQALQEERSGLIKEHAAWSLKAKEAEEEVKALREQHTQLVTLVQTHEEEAKKATDELQAIKLKETQLERVIQFLRKRSEEAHLETNQLTQELAHTQTETTKLTEELTRSTRALADIQEELSQKEATFKQGAEELIALQGQLQALSVQFAAQSEELQRAEQEIARLQQELHEQNTLYDTLSKEHTFFKASMMRSVDEAKAELKEMETKHAAQLKEEEKSRLAREKELTDEIAQLYDTLHTLEAREAIIEEAERLKEAVEKERGTFYQEIELLKNQNQQLIADKEEIEQRFKTAQQHLAKKVRETALATEKIDTEKLKSLELQSQLNQAHIKISELKNSLEMEAEHQKRALARESELLKNAEGQIARLEEKFFQIHEKWKEAEAEVRELKRVEEKWREAEKLFSKLGHFAVKTTPPTELPLDAEIRETAAAFKTEPVTERVYEQISLFEDGKKETPRYKESFL